MTKYTALIIDLIKSKRYSVGNRSIIQFYIRDLVDILNDVFENSLKKPVDFSAGDEIQGLFSSTEAAYLYFRLFSMMIHPVEIRAGIGVGSWDIVLDNYGTTSQDGQAYHYARYAIEETKETLGYTVLLYSDSKSDIFVNSLFNSTALIISKQSEYQNDMMLLSELLSPIDANGIINKNNLRYLVDFIRHIRNERCFGAFNFKNGAVSNKSPLLVKINFDELDCHPIDALEEGDGFFVMEGRVKGMSAKIADYIGISRQSVEKTLKAGNIYASRNLAVTTIKYLNTEWGRDI